LFVSQSYQLLPHFVRFRAMFMPKLGQAQFVELVPQQIYTSFPIYCHCGYLPNPLCFGDIKQGGETNYINFSITPGVEVLEAVVVRSFLVFTEFTEFIVVVINIVVAKSAVFAEFQD